MHGLSKLNFRISHLALATVPSQKPGLVPNGTYFRPEADTGIAGGVSHRISNPKKTQPGGRYKSRGIVSSSGLKPVLTIPVADATGRACNGLRPKKVARLDKMSRHLLKVSAIGLAPAAHYVCFAITLK